MRHEKGQDQDAERGRSEPSRATEPRAEEALVTLPETALSSEHRPLAFGTDAPLQEIMRTARAMRRFKPDPAPPDLLEELVGA